MAFAYFFSLGIFDNIPAMSSTNLGMPVEAVSLMTGAAEAASILHYLLGKSLPVRPKEAVESYSGTIHSHLHKIESRSY